MKIEKMVWVLKEFDKELMTEQEALDELKDAEPFDFYAATLELYLEGTELDKGDSPRISNLFKELYKDDFTTLVKDLEEGHPIERLMRDHLKIETLLNRLEGINLSIKEDRVPDDLIKIDLIALALKHLNDHILKEEKLIFPLWYEREGMADGLLLEEEHKDILKIHQRLLEKSQEKKEDWNEEDWKELSEIIDELIGELRFHTFHEGDIFYPIMVDKFEREVFEDMKEKMDDIDRKNSDPSLLEYIRDVSKPVLSKKEKY